MSSGAPGGRDLRPVVAAGVTAVLSLALVVAAARWGWLGPDVGRGSGFCEAATTGWVRQPVNTWSNLGFVVAGLAVAWHAGDRTRLGLTPAVVTPASRIVVVEVMGRALGLLVDRVSQVTKVPVDSVAPPPEEVVSAETDFLTGVARWDSRLIMLLDLDKVLLLNT